MRVPDTAAIRARREPTLIFTGFEDALVEVSIGESLREPAPGIWLVSMKDISTIVL